MPTTGPDRWHGPKRRRAELPLGGVLVSRAGARSTEPKHWKVWRILVAQTTPRIRSENRDSARLKGWALQLLLGTRRDAGVALCTQRRWPRPWVKPGSRQRHGSGENHEQGSREGPGSRESQKGILVWRIVRGDWPDAADGVAGWWEALRALPKTPTARRRRLAI